MANLKNLKVSKVSFEAVKESAAEVSGTIGVSSIENKMSTAEQAPYLPRIISNGTVDLDAHCRTVVPLMGEDATFEQVRYQWNSMMELVAEILTDGTHTSVDFGYWRFDLEVSGSVPAANSECGPENVVYIGVYPCAELQNVAASIEAKANVSLLPFELKEVFGHDHLLGSVQAGKDMTVMGLRLSMGATGEKIELTKGTTTAACTYKPIENDLPTRFRATVPSTLAAGKGYTLVVTAKGKNGDTLTTITKENIEVRAADTPEKRKIKMTTLVANMMGETCTVETTGENFADVQNYSESGGYVTLPCKYSINGGAEIDGGFMGSPSNPLTLNISSGVSAGDTVKVILTPDPAKIDVDQNLVEKTATAA